MADVKISALPAATTPLAGTEVLPIVQSSTTKKVAVSDLTAGRAMSATSLTLTTPLAASSGGTGLSALGTGVATALGVNTGTAGAFVVNGGALGTPSSGTLTNCTGIPAGGITGTLGVTNGGTGLTSLAAGYIPYGNGTGAFSANSGLSYSNNNLILGSGQSLAGLRYFDISNLDTTSSSGSIMRFITQNVAGTGNVAVNIIKYKNGSFVISNTETDSAANIAFQVGASERMRITSGGLVGIGTSSPSVLLDVRSNASSVAQFFGAAGNTFISLSDNGGTGTANLGSIAGGNWYLYTAGYGAFYTGSAEKMRLDASGNLGLGVTPSAWPGQSASYFVAQINKLALYDAAGGGGRVSYNAYINSVGTNTYISTAAATRYDQSAGQHIWYNAPSGTAGDAISFTQAMTLDASGNLGVGETSPATYGKMVVKGASSVFNLISTNTTGNCYQSFYSNSGSTNLGYIGFGSAGNNDFTLFAGQSGSKLDIYTSGAFAARIDASGNLLVGTTSASASSGQGVKILPGGLVYAVAPTSSGDNYNYYNTTASAYRFYVSSAGTINATSTTITAISDRRLKENIVDLDVGLDALLTLKPRKFDWKAGKGKDIKGDRGWIADEFQQVFPDLIDTWKDTPPEGEEPYKSVRPDLMPVIVKAIQELAAKVSALEAKQ